MQEINKTESSISQSKVRFSDAPWYFKDKTPPYIMIGGAGGIGSWTTFMLGRIGYGISVFDDDRIDETNIGGQLFSRKDIGQYKVEALASMIVNFSDTVIVPEIQKVVRTTPVCLYTIAAFDNMKARRDLFEKWLEVHGSDPNAIFIDGRLTAEQIQIYCIKGGSSDKIRGDQDNYLKQYLFDDSEVADEACTFKQTSHAAAMIASHIVGFLTNHITNVVEKDNIRSVPFRWEYYIPIDFLEVIT